MFTTWINVIALCLLLLFNSCLEEPTHIPVDLAKPNIESIQEVNLLTDILLAESIIGKQNKQAVRKHSKKSLYTFIYKKYNINQEVVDSLIDYYIYYPDEYDAIYEEVKKNVNSIALTDSLPIPDSLALEQYLIDSLAQDSISLEKLKLDSIKQANLRLKKKIK